MAQHPRPHTDVAPMCAPRICVVTLARCVHGARFRECSQADACIPANIKPPERFVGSLLAVQEASQEGTVRGCAPWQWARRDAHGVAHPWSPRAWATISSQHNVQLSTDLLQVFEDADLDKSGSLSAAELYVALLRMYDKVRQCACGKHGCSWTFMSM